MKRIKGLITLSLVLASSFIVPTMPVYADGYMIINQSQAEIQSEADYVNSQGQYIINSIIPGNMNAADKVKAINNYLVMNVQYDFSMKNHDAYDAFYYKKAVCQGYAEAAKKLFDLAGIQNRLIYGTQEGSSHEWNLINIDGAWYHVDVTNNDVVIRDQYLLVGDQKMRDSKYVWDASQYPDAPSNYYNKDISYIDNDNYDSYNTIDNVNAYNVSVGQPILDYSKKFVNENYDADLWNESVRISNERNKEREKEEGIKIGWKKTSSGTYNYYDNNGKMLNGWQEIDGNKYYLNDDGRMQTGWFKNKDGKWYYFNEDGSMATYKAIDGYYVGSKGYWVQA